MKRETHSNSDIVLCVVYRIVLVLDLYDMYDPPFPFGLVGGIDVAS